MFSCRKVPVEKHSPLTKTWIEVADMFDNRQSFCACAFMDNIYIMEVHGVVLLILAYNLIQQKKTGQTIFGKKHP